MSREQYIEWCNKRALGWLNAGKTQIALLTFQQDLEAKPEHNLTWYAEKGVFLMGAGLLETKEEIEAYINGLGERDDRVA